MSPAMTHPFNLQAPVIRPRGAEAPPRPSVHDRFFGGLLSQDDGAEPAVEGKERPAAVRPPSHAA